jgi:hypothetical protein
MAHLLDSFQAKIPLGAVVVYSKSPPLVCFSRHIGAKKGAGVGLALVVEA